MSDDLLGKIFQMVEETKNAQKKKPKRDTSSMTEEQKERRRQILAEGRKKAQESRRLKAQAKADNTEVVEQPIEKPKPESQPSFSSLTKELDDLKSTLSSYSKLHQSMMIEPEQPKQEIKQEEVKPPVMETPVEDKPKPTYILPKKKNFVLPKRFIM